MVSGQSRVDNARHAYLSEIFSSIQGEGLLVGLRQIFIRFSGCLLSCKYCDTPESRVQSSKCNIAGAYGNKSLPNPVSLEKLTEIINSFNIQKFLHHSISLTGGEPLEQVGFLKEWLPIIRRDMLCHSPAKIYLETNGLLSSNLSEIIDFIDIIGMDIKLPSVTGGKPLWDLHNDFLKVATGKEVFVKVVVDSMTDVNELRYAADIVYSVNPEIPFIIQPRSPVNLDATSLLEFQEVVAGKLVNVRVIPQVHKFLNLK